MNLILKESAVRVLEGAAFLFTDELPPERIPAKESTWDSIGVTLRYEGPNTGSIDLWISIDLAKSVAVNMLGLDSIDDVKDSQVIDAIKELLNMVVGNYLTDAFGTEDVYHLGIPEVLALGGWLVGKSDDSRLWIDVEGQPCMFADRPDLSSVP